MAAFYTDYDNFQAQSSQYINGALQQKLNNVGKLRTKGVEVEAQAMPVEWLRLDASAAYTDAEVISFPNAACYPGQAQTGVGCAPSTNPVGLGNVQDRSNTQLPNSPKFKVNLGGTVTRDLSSDLKGVFTVNYQYQSKVNFDLLGNPLAEQKAYGLLNASASIERGDVKATLFVNNLLNEHFVSGIGDGFGSYGVHLVDPGAVARQRPLLRSQGRHQVLGSPPRTDLCNEERARLLPLFIRFTPGDLYAQRPLPPPLRPCGRRIGLPGRPRRAGGARRLGQRRPADPRAQGARRLRPARSDHAGQPRPRGLGPAGPEAAPRLQRLAPDLTLMPGGPAVDKDSPAVILVPGGGFQFLAMDNEGYDVAKRLAPLGVRVFILKYRTIPLPDSFDGFKAALAATFQRGEGGEERTRRGAPYAIADAQAAIRAVRDHAREWRVDPQRVGVLGFSAGAMTVLGALQANTPDARPDFAGMIYGPTQSSAVPPNAPPLFAALAADDRFFRSQDFSLIQNWRASGASVELHLYSAGGHGFASQPHGTTSDAWFDQYALWLKAMKLTP
ncbi:TonB-dependent receptor domain-containing protein [Caulobacter segnis]